MPSGPGDALELMRSRMTTEGEEGSGTWTAQVRGHWPADTQVQNCSVCVFSPACPGADPYSSATALPITCCSCTQRSTRLWSLLALKDTPALSIGVDEGAIHGTHLRELHFHYSFTQGVILGRVVRPMGETTPCGWWAT